MVYIKKTHSHKELLIHCPQGSEKNIIDVIAYIVRILGTDGRTNEQMNVYGPLKQKQ
jgi:hypothetical protein